MDSTAKSMSSDGQKRWFSAGHSTSHNCSIVAPRNHGNSANGKNNSSSPSNSQKPCFETWVISAWEVDVPGMGYLLHVNNDKTLSFLDLFGRKPGTCCQRQFRRQPKLGFPIGMANMHMHSRLFPRKEKEPKTTLTKNCRRHGRIIAPNVQAKGRRAFTPALGALAPMMSGKTLAIFAQSRSNAGLGMSHRETVVSPVVSRETVGCCFLKSSACA